MGLGLHGGGLGVARWLLRHGARLTVTDLRDAATLRSSVRALEAVDRRSGSTVRFVLGAHRKADFRNADLIVQNPGVPRTSPYLRVARRARVPVTNELFLFLGLVRHLTGPDYVPPRITAVTGTRGKSTTTALIHAMLEADGRTAVVAGNLRIPMFDHIDRIVRASRTKKVEVVLELSSWHCEHLGVESGGPDVAVLTNIQQDHLNRYPSMRSYIAAKARLIRFQDPRSGVAILNGDDPVLQRLASHGPRAVRWFQHDRPHGAGWSGVYRDGRDIRVREHGRHRTVARVGDLRLPGAHNTDNALAAISAARVLEVPAVHIRSALRGFRGLPGRLEIVSRHGGITYVNDTCATTPDAAIAAVRAYGAPPSSGQEHEERRRTIVLIAGGTDKELQYHAWARVVHREVKTVVFLPGTATEKMRRALEVYHRRPSCVQYIAAASMRDAVRRAGRSAVRGDIILLSPGAASFGLFLHEFDRGDQFVRASSSSRRSA